MKPETPQQSEVSIPSIAMKFQIAFVVRDARKVAENFSRLGIGPFIEETYPGINAKVHGKPANYKLLTFTANFGPVEVEINQVIDGNPIHKEFLESRGEGIHHIGIYVQDYDQEVSKWKKSFDILQESRLPPPYPKQGGYAFFDTEKLLGVVLELANPPPPDLGKTN